MRHGTPMGTQKKRWIQLISVGILTHIGLLTVAHAAPKSTNAVDAIKRQAELQIKNVVEPVLTKYCPDECKFMGATVEVDLMTSDEVAPGFEDPGSDRLAPSSASVTLLIDEKVGPNSRGKLLELVQQFADTLDFPVKLDTRVTRFPQPVGSASKIAELKDRVSKQFKETVEGLFTQFCPDQCLLADFDLKTEVVNAEEAQYGSQGEFIEDGGVALRMRNVSATILVDDIMSPEERQNVLEMAKLKTNYLKNVNLTLKTLKFPQAMIAGGRGRSGEGTSEEGSSTSRSLASTSSSNNSNSSESKSSQTNARTDSSTLNSNESSAKQERFERTEKIERVENGDAVQKELQKFKVVGLILACIMLALLVFVAMATLNPRAAKESGFQKIISNIVSDPASTAAPLSGGSDSGREDRTQTVVARYEIERLTEELMAVYAQSPKVAKQVFSRVLTEEGIETTAQYIAIFGESVVMDMLRDPSLQSDLSELMEYYAKNPQSLNDEDKLELLRALHNRTIAGKMVVMGSRSTAAFDFLVDMDGLQILELIKNESLTVKSIVLTQCDHQKRAQIYSQLDEKTRLDLMHELSRIDYLPRDYIANVATALRRKRRENPKLNTEALPGSEVLLTLLERSTADQARSVIKGLEMTNPESARVIKSKLVSVDTLKHLRDGQLLEVILSLKHDELLQFLKGASDDLRMAVFNKSPQDLVVELEEELATTPVVKKELYQTLERKILNRLKIMSNDGMINLVETNERMLGETGNEGTGVMARAVGR